jgi:hypothetical protein
MPKISDIEETPNPNAVKFILREPVSNGVARQYGSAELAANDPLAKSLFDVGNVVSIFYMDKMITVEKEDEADWDELLPALAVPIRAAEAVTSTNAAAAAAAAVGGPIAALASDDPRLLKVIKSASIFAPLPAAAPLSGTTRLIESPTNNDFFGPGIVAENIS